VLLVQLVPLDQVERRLVEEVLLLRPMGVLVVAEPLNHPMVWA
jgi:hypothetical protein